MLKIVKGNIFESKDKYLVHQCNCVTNRAAHLALDVFTRYPYSDIYSYRATNDTPGKIIIKGNGIDQRFVVALLGQKYPGKSKYPDSAEDGLNSREEYFHLGLIALSKISNLESIAFPWKIGCGAAGGNWENYLSMLINFADYVYNFGTQVTIYKKD